MLAIEQYGAGPFGTQFLADMGAEVIKVEDLPQGGDVGRSIGPSWLDAGDESERSVVFQGLNRGKKSNSLDLQRPQGWQTLLKVLGSCDAVMSNLRGDVPQKLDLTYDQLGDRWPVYDFLMQAEVGCFSLTGEPGSALARAELSLVKLKTGSILSMAVLAAVMAARESGQGRDEDVSLFDLALYDLKYIGHWYLNHQCETTWLPRSSHASLTPCQTCKTQDGWIYLMCNKEKFWRMLCQHIDRTTWIEDPRFLGFTDRLLHRDLLTELIHEALATRTTKQWMAIFEGSVPAAPTLDVKQALDNPWVRDAGRIEYLPVSERSRFTFITLPIRYANRAPEGLAPALGQHISEILLGVGLSLQDNDDLRQQGVV